MPIQIEPSDLVKIAVFGTSLGGALAAVKPFALHLFQRWLAGQDKRDAVLEKIADEQVGMGKSIERVIGVLEAQHKTQERTEKRLDRIEGRLGIAGSSDIPPPPTPVSPRASITSVTNEGSSPPSEVHAPKAGDTGKFRPVEAR